MANRRRERTTITSSTGTFITSKYELPRGGGAVLSHKKRTLGICWKHFKLSQFRILEFIGHWPGKVTSLTCSVIQQVSRSGQRYILSTVNRQNHENVPHCGAQDEKYCMYSRSTFMMVSWFLNFSISSSIVMHYCTVRRRFNSSPRRSSDKI